MLIGNAVPKKIFRSACWSVDNTDGQKKPSKENSTQILRMISQMSFLSP